MLTIHQPMSEHNLVFGYLLAIKKALNALPTGAHPTLALSDILQRFPAGLFLILISGSMGVSSLIVTSATMANQAAQQSDLALESPVELCDWFRPITGRPTLSDLSGHECKPWRSLFKPGFSALIFLRTLQRLWRGLWCIVHR